MQRLGKAGELEEATLKRLREIERNNTPMGVMAIWIAREVDTGQHSGSQAAALLREYRAAIEATEKGLVGGSSTLDQLRKRREQRHSA